MPISFNSKALDVVATRELLPRILTDIPGVDLFTDWTFTGLRMEPTHTGLVGEVRARQRGTNLICTRRFTVSTQTLQYNSNTQHLLLILDREIEESVKWITRMYVPHKPGVLCVHNAFCEECYA